MSSPWSTRFVAFIGLVHPVVHLFDVSEPALSLLREM